MSFNSPILVAKCLATVAKNTMRMSVPYLKFDAYLNQHFRENLEVYALDKNEICNPNDWVLIRKLPEKYSIKVDYIVEKILYKCGDIVDPISGKRVAGYNYIDSENK